MHLSILKCIVMLVLPPETTWSETSSGLGEGTPCYPGRQIGDAPTGFGENINKENKNSHPSSGPRLNTTMVGNVF